MLSREKLWGHISVKTPPRSHGGHAPSFNTLACITHISIKYFQEAAYILLKVSSFFAVVQMIRFIIFYFAQLLILFVSH